MSSVAPDPPPYTPQAAVYTTKSSYGVNGKQMPPPPQAITASVSGGVTTAYLYGVQPKRVFSRHPTSLICQHCNASVVTKPRAEVGAFTWLIAGGMVFVGLWLGCCIIPFFIDECKDIYHECPKCNKLIDVYKRL